MKWTIEKRCRQRHTSAFVVADTVDVLGEKMIGIIADRRMTKMHRYLGDSAGTPQMFAGLRVWHGGYGAPTEVRSGLSAHVRLASAARRFEGVGFGVGRDDETEEELRDRYHHPDQQFLGQRRDITLVRLDGVPGSPGRDDSIQIEYWNENGVGQETLIAFDDMEPLQEIAWNVKGDIERRVYFDEEFCTTHARHYEDPVHEYRHGVCALRPATLAETLLVLAALASGGAS